MNNATATVLVVLTSLSFMTSAATLTYVVLGAKKVQTQVDAIKIKTEDTRKKTKEFLASLDI